jgi:putative ABC transport system substrate-binding protein
MDRRTLIRGLSTLAVLAPLAAEAQQAGTVYRIGYLSPGRRDQVAHIWDAFERTLRDLGYVEGRNIVLERRFADGKLEQLPKLVAELVRLKVDLIVAGTNASIVAAKQATTAIPIVMVLALDPVGMGFIASYAKPGGNLTGTAFDVSPETAGKTVELLKEIAPRLTRLAVFWNPSFPGRRQYVKSAEDAGQRLGIAVDVTEMRMSTEIDPALAAVSSQRVGAIFVISDPVLYARRRDIAVWAVKDGRPTVCDLREFVEAGSLMSYGASMAELARRAAMYVDKILKGAKPADLPVEQPTKFELVINRKTAKALGLTIPQSLLLRADQVIE